MFNPSLKLHPHGGNGQKEGSIPSAPTMKLTKQDWQRYAPDKPDPNYNVKKNKAVIENSIKQYEARRKAVMDKFNDELGERSEAIASYLKSDAIHSGKPAEKYFGKRILAQLRGEQIVNELKMRGDSSFSMMDVVKNKPFTDMRKVNAKKEKKGRG